MPKKKDGQKRLLRLISKDLDLFLSDKETGGSTAAVAVTRVVVKRKPDFVFKILRLNSCLGWAADWAVGRRGRGGSGSNLYPNEPRQG